MLDLVESASQPQIRAAYRRLARQLHPDAGGNAAVFRLVREAFETLSNPDARSSYDAARKGTSPAAPAPAAAAEPERAELDPEELSWWDEVDPQGAVSVLPAFHRGRVTAIVAAAAWLGLTLWLAGLWWSQVWPGWVICHVVLALYAAGSAATSAWLRLSPQANLAAAVVGVATVLGAGRSADDQVLLTVLCAAWLIGFLLIPILVFRWLATWPLDSQLPARDFGDLRIFGRPAGSTPELELAARAAAEDLCILCRIPAVRVAHRLDDPASGEPLADHAVICGDQVAVVASRRWPPGSYHFDNWGAPWRSDGQPVHGWDAEATLARVQQLLPDKTELCGFLIVYPDDSVGPIDVDDDGQAFLAGEPAYVLEAIGRWLSVEPEVVSRRTLVAALELIRR